MKYNCKPNLIVRTFVVVVVGVMVAMFLILGIATHFNFVC
jgi:hypothetical protein